MVERAQVVDSLAERFRPTVAAGERLVLDATDIDVVVRASVAQVAITRRFANRRGEPIEAVVALPPCARGEVVNTLTVVVNGDVYSNEADAATNAAGNAPPATRVIIYYPIDDLLQLIAIGGIPAGADVSVRVVSERHLDAMGASLASLVIQLGDDHGRIMPTAPGRDTAVPAAGRNETTLSITADGSQVTAQGRLHLANGDSVPIHAAPWVVLGLIARDGGTFAAARGDARVGVRAAVGSGFRFPRAEGASDDLSALRLPALRELVPSPLTAPSSEPPVEPPQSTLPEAPYLIKPGST